MSTVLPIQPDDRFRRYTASAGQTVFPIAFPFQQDADVTILLETEDGYDLVEDTGYAITGAGAAEGGSLTFGSGRAAGDVILVLGAAILDRLSSIVRDGKFASKLTDDELDRNRIIQQEHQRDIGRAAKSDYGEDAFTFASGMIDGSSIKKVGNRLVAGPDVAAADAAERYERIAADNATRALMAATYTTTSMYYETRAGAMLVKIPLVMSSILLGGYETAGDGPCAFYVRVPAPTTVKPWHFQDALGNWWQLSTNQDIYPEMFGAKADPLVDDTAAIQAAFDFKLVTRFRDRNYYLTGSLTWTTKQQLIGALGVNGSSTSETGGTRLIFTGSGDACFVQKDKTAAFNYGGMRGITVRCTGNYDFIIDVYSALRFYFIDSELQPTGMATSAMRSQKINPGDNSWLNVIINSNIILPTGSTGKALDEDWSDSVIFGSTFGGGLGNFSRGYGNKVLANNFERASNAGLTMKAKNTGVGSLVSGCFFDANKNYGVVIDTSDDPSTSAYQVNHVFTGNKFRTVDPTTGAAGIADIYLRPDDSNRLFNGPTIGVNSHTVSAVPQLLHDPAKWGRVVMALDHNLNVSVTPFSTEVFDLLAYVGYKGINVPSGLALIRGSYTQFGMGGVSGFFGAPGTAGNAGSAGIQLGSVSGVAPFIAASRDGAGNPTGLRSYTDATYRTELSPSGAYFRPAADNSMALGTASTRFSQLFAATPTINTSDEREKEDIEAIPDAVLDAWGDVEWVQFKFKDAAAEKGTAARIHTGLIAQRVKAAFEARGLDATTYGLLCYDEWEDQYEPVMATRTNDAGEEELYDTGETELVLAAGNRYGVRYEEALAMEAALMRRELNKLKAAAAS